MFARSSTMQARLSSIDAGIAFMRDEVMTELAGMPGWVGLSLLVDRDSGRCIVTTAWETEDAMHDSASRVRPLRNRARDVFGGDGPLIEEWDIALLHRDHHAGAGACARVTWSRSDDPDRYDSSINVFRTYALPAMEQMDGFCSASLMVDRSSGRGVSCAIFDSAEAMDRNRQEAAEMREKATSQAGITVTEVSEFELALAHLRVPELV
ncbi:hypothetical protein ACFYUD_20770 [Nocardia tengchongensis]|uniref:hypothetical protein n=1 Tax=Nocardia tengchongensis TaxID=2055889 RepID=UPI0036CB384B